MKEWKAEMLEEEEKEQELESSEMSMADLLRGEEEVSEKLLSREVVRVKVVQVLEDQVLVDVGEKKEGVISRTEFKPGEIPAVGGEVPALLERKASEHSPAVLSYRKAKQVLAWAATQKAFQDKQRVRGRVMRQIKGGYLVDLDGISGFLPLSLSDMRPIHHHHLPVGALVRCYIQEMGKTGNRGARSGESNYHVVLSRKQVLEEDHKQRIQKAMEKLKVGGVYRGVVSQVKEFGFFVGLGGLEGLVHVLDCAWKEPNRALKSFRRGQRVRVKVLKMDLENGKVNLGIKQLLPNPADELRKYFPPKTVVRGKVEGGDATGVRIVLSSQVSGWVRAEDFASEGPPKTGAEVSAIVLGVRAETFDLSLSIKRLEDIEDKKRIRQYLKGAPPLTLGQLFQQEDQEQQK